LCDARYLAQVIMPPCAASSQTSMWDQGNVVIPLEIRLGINGFYFNFENII